MADNRIFTGSLRQRFQTHQYQQYLNRRDTERIHQNTPSRWTQYSSGLMSTLTNVKKRRSARTRGRLVNHLFDWMAHEANLAKGSQQGKAAALCPCVDVLQLRRTSTPHAPIQPCKISDCCIKET